MKSGNNCKVGVRQCVRGIKRHVTGVRPKERNIRNNGSLCNNVETCIDCVATQHKLNQNKDHYDFDDKSNSNRTDRDQVYKR